MSKSEDWSGLDRAALENMSAASLEELLLRDFHAPDGGMDDMSGLYQAACVLAARTPPAPSAADRAWARFVRHYLPSAGVASWYSEDGGMPSSDAAPGRRSPVKRRWIRRLAVAVAAVCAAFLLVSAAAAAGGYDLWRLLARWTDEQMSMAPGQILRAEEDEIRMPEEGKEYAGLQEALDDCGLTRPVVPRWMPEGFALADLGVDTGFPDALIFHAAYQRDEDVLVFLIEIFLPREGSAFGDGGNFQKDEGDPVPYEAGGVTHLLSTNAGRPVAMWANGPAECAVSGDITMEELQKMIDSIY